MPEDGVRSTELPHGVDSQTVRQQLEKISSSPSFINSERLRIFLRFLVEQSLLGTPPKEYTLGVEVFSRDPSYDPKTDPVVRVEARRLRYKLQEYYVEAGKDDLLQIELPKGGYALSFRMRPAAPPPNQSRLKWWGIGLGAALLLGATVLTAVSLQRRNAAPARQVSIAVLPFENLSAEEEQEYFADGMTDALITDLAKIKTLRVLSRTSVLQYKRSRQHIGKIGTALGADYLIEGTVLPAGERIRITAQLISAAGDHHVWAETYDRNLTGILEVQSEIARAIAAQVRIQLTPQDQARLTPPDAVSPAALQKYFQGRYHWNKRTPDGLRRSREFFMEALDIEPNYALAWAGLADAHNLLGSYRLVPMKESHPQARAAAEKAIRLNDNLAEAHASLATVITDYYWDWPLAEREFRRAIDLYPNYATVHLWYSNYLTMMGRHSEALAEVNQAVDLDPLSPVMHGNRGFVLYYGGRYREAIAEQQQVLGMEPALALARIILGLAYIQQGMYPQAVAQFQTIAASNSPVFTPLLGYAHAKAGQRTEALRILGDLRGKKNTHSFSLAYLSLALGNKEEALGLLERAYEEHDVLIGLVKVAPDLAPIRGEKRFVNLLKKLNLHR